MTNAAAADIVDLAERDDGAAHFQREVAELERLLPNPFALEADGYTRRAAGPHLAPLREALINLLVHQDHGDHRVARVLWYTDKIIFDNPGDSLAPVEQILEGGITDCRNPLMMRVLRMARLAEQAGSGVVSVRQRWRELTGQMVSVRNDPAQKIYAIEFVWGEVTEQATEQATEQVQRLLVVLGNGSYSSAELMERLSLQHRPTFLYDYLRPAIDAGLIEMTRPDKPRSPHQKYRLTPAGGRFRAADMGRGTPS